MALHSGEKPLFFWNSSSLENFNQDPEQTLSDLPISASNSNTKFLQPLNKCLAETWGVLKRFCSLVCRAAETGSMLPKETLVDTMASVLYNLTHLVLDPGSLDEAIKLGLLAFSSQIFLQWANMLLYYPYLSNAYRECLFKLKISDEVSPQVSPQVLLWLLTIGTICIFTDADDKWLKPWLRLNIELCEVRSWVDMRAVLDSLIWLSPVHDAHGEIVYSSMI
jgi:hypothetical protein